MTTIQIRGVPVSFPFEAYDLQKTYMEKVIECLQNQSNGILESPTGTGKTMSLLCSSLAWLASKKAEVQSMCTPLECIEYLEAREGDSSNRAGRGFFRLPTIIYASRTHSQLSQAMQELKRSGYRHMKSCIIGSRDQLCIHPEVAKETSSAAKIHMCHLKVATRSCHFYNRVEKAKIDPAITSVDVMDIEDLVKSGEKNKFCPYFMSKELKQEADIIFMPYNYLIDPRSRKALGIELCNNVIIFDEAHNIEGVCEDATSHQIKASDLLLCIEEVTVVMKAMAEPESFSGTETPRDFTADELCIFKKMLLDFELALDSIELRNKYEGTTFNGGYIFELFKKAGITDSNYELVISLTEKIIQFLAVARDGPFQRKGNGLQLFEDFLRIAFSSVSHQFKLKINECYKVHVSLEESRKKSAGSDWLSKASGNGAVKVLNFWCFSPGFGMKMLIDKGVHCVILTSGTLAPLQPLISELDLDVKVQLENPHIVKPDQICVKIVKQGPDLEELNSNYQNRENPKYITSLGNTILNLTRIIPNGMLIFFPSYPILHKLQENWQLEGIWSNIASHKAIFVEPKGKDAFNTAMNEYYNRVNDPMFKGAIFMGVCRGKVSEGLDFADINGRAVIITGLPYPPLKDPKIILKRQYLDGCNLRDQKYLRGGEWYGLEATRAVNQAIGRVIRHRYDYGAIILLDSRFTSHRIKNQMSKWLRDQIREVKNFGELIKDLRMFFRNAQTNLPAPKLKQLLPLLPSDVTNQPSTSHSYKKGFFNFGSSSTTFGNSSDTANPVHISKRKKVMLVSNSTVQEQPNFIVDVDINEYIIMVKKTLNKNEFKTFTLALTTYRDTSDFSHFINSLDKIFLNQYNIRYLLQGLKRYIKANDKENFEAYWEKMR